MAAFSVIRRIRRRRGMLLKFTARQTHSCVAQWQSIRLLIGRLLVRVQPQELIARSPSPTGWGSEAFWEWSASLWPVHIRPRTLGRPEAGSGLGGVKSVALGPSTEFG